MSGKSDFIGIRLKLYGERQVALGLEKVSKGTKGLGKSTHYATTKSKAATGVTSGLTRSYKQLGTAARWGLGFLGVGGVLAIESSIRASEELSKTTIGLSRNLGLQTNVASRWGAVAVSREIDTKSLNMAFGSLSTKMVEAGRKGGTLLTPFHQLGISQEEAEKGANNFQWGLLRVAKALGEEEGGAKRSTAAKVLLGRGYQTLLPLFAEGTAGLKEQLHWADKYGVTLSTGTNDAIMEMVMAQRENKVAMLGLQLSLTKALMPAIKAGDDQLQEFIATLNSPNLTAEQKISRISKQFMGLEDDLVHIIELALPHIAEQGGHLGVVLAGAIWHGFWNSDTLGKLVIGAWIFRAFGGAGLVKAGARRVGGMIGLEMGLGLVAGITGFLVGWELGRILEEKTHGEFHRWATAEAENFVNAFTGATNTLLDKTNFLAIFGVEAPNIPEVHLKNAEEEVASGAHITHHLLPPGQVPPGSEGPGITESLPGRHHHHGNHGERRNHRHLVPKAAYPRQRRSVPREVKMLQMPQGRGGERTLVLKNELHVDGQKFAELITRHALDEAALR